MEEFKSEAMCKLAHTVVPDEEYGLGGMDCVRFNQFFHSLNMRAWRQSSTLHSRRRSSRGGGNAKAGTTVNIQPGATPDPGAGGAAGAMTLEIGRSASLRM
ncbi:unnamed protein product [Symbiodinium sp. CCMP2592]|nr:unnamed protein product [Symbiodinium sp. CCMP2592]